LDIGYREIIEMAFPAPPRSSRARMRAAYLNSLAVFAIYHVQWDCLGDAIKWIAQAAIDFRAIAL